MIDLNNPENITFVFSILGGVVTFLSVIWIKVIKPIIYIVDQQNNLAKSIETITKELTTNGGDSIKDAIIELKGTCNRIELRQAVIEERTKSALQYNNAALFETNEKGALVWTNSNFQKLILNTIKSVEGYDWLNYIAEYEREGVIDEFKSCLEMNRKFFKRTTNLNGEKIELEGFPYKINHTSHGGFIVNLSIVKEKQK